MNNSGGVSRLGLLGTWAPELSEIAFARELHLGVKGEASTLAGQPFSDKALDPASPSWPSINPSIPNFILDQPQAVLFRSKGSVKMSQWHDVQFYSIDPFDSCATLLNRLNYLGQVNYGSDAIPQPIQQYHPKSHIDPHPSLFLRCQASSLSHKHSRCSPFASLPLLQPMFW